MFKIGSIEIKDALLLAPMEDVTDVSFRLVCHELGADVVYTEFVNSEGLVRGSEKTHKKLEVIDEERPVGIQIYGGSIPSMVKAAMIAEEENPDLIDINAGCWVKGVVACGAGAGLLKEPDTMVAMAEAVVKTVNKPVTVKTRIGWDKESIGIVELAQRLEDVGVQSLTVHCRTRSQAHNGEPDWSWIPRIKEKVSMPIVVNGGIMTAHDAKRAFEETGADGVMIARGAIGYPWIFKETKELLQTGTITDVIDEKSRIYITLKHLKTGVRVKGERRAVLEHRKFYSGYLKGLPFASQIRNTMMQITTYDAVEEVLLAYLERLNQMNREEPVA